MCRKAVSVWKGCKCVERLHCKCAERLYVCTIKSVKYCYLKWPRENTPSNNWAKRNFFTNKFRGWVFYSVILRDLEENVWINIVKYKCKIEIFFKKSLTPQLWGTHKLLWDGSRMRRKRCKVQFWGQKENVFIKFFLNVCIPGREI